MRLFVNGNNATFARLLPRYREHLGCLVTPRWGAMRTIQGWSVPWGADNECFQGLDAHKYRLMLGRIKAQPGCVFVCLPDVVGDARATLALWAEWSAEVSLTGQPMALVGQDGAEDLALPWDRMQGYFIGGSTKWKLSQASADLAREAKRWGLWVHMGRVNSRARLRRAWDMGCDSVDGTGATRMPDRDLPRMLRWLVEIERQPTLPTIFAA